MSQEQLSEKVDVDPRYISRIELGRCSPSMETLEKIALALSVDMRDLFDYGHQLEGIDWQAEIAELLGKAKDDQQRQLILRIVKAVTRSVVNDL
jgi:transcriptional regulator with XRE-family HTH domain